VTLNVMLRNLAEFTNNSKGQRVTPVAASRFTLCLLGLIAEHGDGGSRFLRNVSELLPDHMVLYPSIWNLQDLSSSHPH
jgi:hypothetical protein